MKALTICQPYAHLILTGEKPVENRTWTTRFRGPLLIHAGKSRSWMDEDDERRYPDIVFGAIVGRVDMVDALSASSVHRLHADLRDNEHVNGPWCFLLRNPVRFERPIPYRGAQGFFDVPDSLLSSAGGDANA